MFSADALSFRQQSRLAISLSWVGGFTNIFAFLTFKTFASHMTGASTLLGAGAALANIPDILLYGALVSAFLCGAVASALMTELAKRRSFQSRYLLPLALEALLLCILVIALGTSHADATSGRIPLLGLIAFAMGLQNATITKISGAVVRSTHLTGVITDLGIESVHLALWLRDQLRGRRRQRARRILQTSRRHPTLQRIVLLASIWTSFVFGTAVGALAVNRFHERALLAPIAFILFLIVLQLAKPALKK